MSKINQAMLAIFMLFSITAYAKVRVGQVAPDFGQRSIFDETKEVWLGDQAGPGAADKHKALLLVFAASYCKPCWKELPEVMKIHKKYASQGLGVLYVIADMEPAGRAKAKKRLLDAKVDFPCVRMKISSMADTYMGKTWNMPAMFVISADRRIKANFYVLDRAGLSRLDTLIQTLLKDGK